MNTQSHVLVERATSDKNLLRIARKWEQIHGRRTRVYICSDKKEVWLSFDGQPVMRAGSHGPRGKGDAVPVEDYLGRVSANERKVA